jgi:hypothetical protein
VNGNSVGCDTSPQSNNPIAYHYLPNDVRLETGEVREVKTNEDGTLQRLVDYLIDYRTSEMEAILNVKPEPGNNNVCLFTNKIKRGVLGGVNGCYFTCSLSFKMGIIV